MAELDPALLIDQFAAEHFTLNSISPARQHQVRAALTRLDEWLDCSLVEATDADLRAWLVDLLGADLTPSTVAWYLKMVKPFYRWAWRSRLIDADTWMRLNDVSAPRGSSTTKPRPYSRRELRTLWVALDERFPHASKLLIGRWQRGTSPWRSMKKHAMRLQLDAIIELALVCGLRRSEIYRLSIDDVHWDNKYIVVHGKRVDQNPKVRDVPYPESTRNAIRAWFRLRGLMGPAPGLPLWLSVTGPDPVAAMPEERFAMLLHCLGPYELHRLRHTCATERLRAGMELQEVQKFLGHSNLQQTLAYAELVRDDIHRASDRIDPAFQKSIRPKAA